MADDSTSSNSTLPPRRTGGVRTRGGRLTPARGRGSAPSGSAIKKEFVPTIPQRRVKKENRQCEDKSSTSEKKGDVKDFKRGRGRARREYVCLSGAIFGEGLAQDRTKKGSVDVCSTFNTRICTPAFKPVKQRSKKELADEEQQLKDEDEEDYSGSGSDDGDLPLILPFKTLLDMNVKTEEEIKQEPKNKLENMNIKQETKTELENTNLEQEPKTELEKEFDIKAENKLKLEDVKTLSVESSADTKIAIKIKEEKSFSINDDIRNIFRKGDDETQEFLLVQFPANVPSEDQDSTMEMPSTSTKSETSAEEKEPEKTRNANLMDVEEGLIGKLQLMKSGAIRLMCGSTILYLDQSKANFMEELVSLRKSDDSEAEMIQLGKIARHIVISPIMEQSC